MATLEDIKKIVRAGDPQQLEDDEGFQAQVVMLASLEVGTNIHVLKKFTDYSYTLLRKFNSNLRKAGIWHHGRVYANWSEDPLSFYADTCVALGWMNRVS